MKIICDKFKKLAQKLIRPKSEKSNEIINQKQVAGADSQQLQVGSIVINQGITEERVRTVFSEMIPQALTSYTLEAHETAVSRINKLEQVIMSRIEKIEGAFSSFADPEFQILLRKVQQSAAATEKEDDYALLTELLACRIEKGNNRIIKTGISKATEIVSEIDNDALCAMTIVHAVNSFSPVASDCQRALSVIDSLFSKLLYAELPTGKEWIDHLEVLNAIRILQISKFKKIGEYYHESWNGIVCLGIKKDSDEYRIAVEKMSSEHLPNIVFVDNELIEGFVRIPVLKESEIENLVITNEEAGTKTPLSLSQIQVLHDIWNMYFSDKALINEVKKEFIKRWDTYPSLYKVRKWWDSIPETFSLTSIGTVLSHANAQRCDNTLPDLV